MSFLFLDFLPTPSEKLHFRSHLPTDAVSGFEDGMRWIATSLHVPSSGEKGIPGAYARFSSTLVDYSAVAFQLEEHVSPAADGRCNVIVRSGTYDIVLSSLLVRVLWISLVVALESYYNTPLSAQEQRHGTMILVVVVVFFDIVV